MPLKAVRSLIAALPTTPGVYRFQADGGTALYVGKAANLKKRVASYFQKKRQSPRIALMLDAACSLETIVTDSPAEALLLENNLIKSLRPKYNILFRDDKSYPLLKISAHAYPRLTFHRGAAKNGDACFGPFPDSAAVRGTIDILQQVFRLRTCADNVLSSRTRPCLLHGIGRCSAPCVNAIKPAEYAADVQQATRLLSGGASPVADSLRRRMEEAAEAQRYEEAAALRDRLRALTTVQSRHFAEDAAAPNADYVGVAHDGRRACVNIIMVRGGRRIGEKRLFPDNAAVGDAEKVMRAFLAQHYCRQTPPAKIFPSVTPTDWRTAAPHLIKQMVARPRGQAAQHVAQAAANAKHALHMRDAQRAGRETRTETLQKRLNLPHKPRRLECFDISHSMGEEAVAARAVFVDGAPEKREYRLFRIKTATGGDDAAAMHEAVSRCYRRAVAENSPLPDALFIDGGGAQVAAAKQALAETLMERPPPPLFGVAKGAARKPGEETLICADGELLRLPATDDALHLIQALRDEAHRFAGEGHRRRRDKKRASSFVLDGIEGVGEKKRRQLMLAFGGLAALRAASAGELAKVSGVGAQLAGRIYQALHR